MLRIKILLIVLPFIFNCQGQTKGTMPETHQYTNSLINETSPYLLQHAHNPVNWYAWNKETLALAKKEDKLLRGNAAMLSISLGWGQVT